jgi:hypothetical protein
VRQFAEKQAVEFAAIGEVGEAADGHFIALRETARELQRGHEIARETGKARVLGILAQLVEHGAHAQGGDLGQLGWLRQFVEAGPGAEVERLGGEVLEALVQGEPFVARLGGRRARVVEHCVGEETGAQDFHGFAEEWRRRRVRRVAKDFLRKDGLRLEGGAQFIRQPGDDGEAGFHGIVHGAQALVKEREGGLRGIDDLALRVRRQDELRIVIGARRQLAARGGEEPDECTEGRPAVGHEPFEDEGDLAAEGDGRAIGPCDDLTVIGPAPRRIGAGREVFDRPGLGIGLDGRGIGHWASSSEVRRTA